MKDMMLINGDCLEELKKLKDNSVNLVLIDPPYNIGKDTWDKWKTVELYVSFLENVFLELQRVLKDNGSFYFFHNDFIQINKIQNMIELKTNFIFKQLIVWNKMFNEAKNKGFLQGFIEPQGLRNYQKMAEYCLFYTFQDETGRKKIDHDINHYKPLREYSKKVQDYIGLNKKEIISIIGGRVDHFFRHKSSQFSLPTKETYEDLTNEFNLRDMEGFKEYEELREEYEELREEYESLREEYESLRYTFNNQKIHHSVWNYEIAKKVSSHITPKPTDLLENIIKHSSNEGDIILDCFMGSGSTGVAAQNLNRKFIGIEIDEEYFNISKKRILYNK
jgi:site-specific DNA-methyltransferase (adenine-specific)